MKRVYSENITNVIKRYLDSENVKYQFDENKGQFRCKYYNIKVIINVNDDDFFVYAYVKMDISDKIKPRLYQYIHIASQHSSFANFAYDEDERQLVCQCYTSCLGFVPTREIVEESIIDVVHRLDCYNDIFLDLLKGKVLSNEEMENISTFEFRRTY